MVINEGSKFVIDGLEEANIMEGIYYMDEYMQVFEARDRYDIPGKTNKFTKLFAPKKPILGEYVESKVYDPEDPNAVKKLCSVKGIYASKRGQDKREIIIIHPSCEAFLCNDNGKTIERIY